MLFTKVCIISLTQRTLLFSYDIPDFVVHPYQFDAVKITPSGNRKENGSLHNLEEIQLIMLFFGCIEIQNTSVCKIYSLERQNRRILPACVETALRQKCQVSNSVDFGISGNDLNVTVQLSFVFQLSHIHHSVFKIGNVL